jgi:hypothetical protein
VSTVQSIGWGWFRDVSTFILSAKSNFDFVPAILGKEIHVKKLILKGSKKNFSKN